MLLTRIVASLVFAPPLLYFVWTGGLGLALTCMVLGLVMLWEFYRLTANGAAFDMPQLVGYGVLVAFNGIIFGWWQLADTALLLPAGVLVLFTTALLFPLPIENVHSRLACVALGILYIGGTISFLMPLRELQEGRILALLAVIGTWMSDTCAYFVGRLLGRHKLYSLVSPNKTIEGAVGGLLAVIGMAFLIRWQLAAKIDAGELVGLALVVGVAGVIGDLCESLIKRSAGVKDSSHLIPGHGGVLDRFDGVMFAVPALYLWRTLVGS